MSRPMRPRRRRARATLRILAGVCAVMGMVVVAMPEARAVSAPGPTTASAATVGAPPASAELSNGATTARPESPASVGTSTTTDEVQPDPLIVLGVHDLTWQELLDLAAGSDPQAAADAQAIIDYATANTPVNLVQRTVGDVTCPADGWLAIGAGSRARADSSHLDGRACSGGEWNTAVQLARSDGYGAELGQLARLLDEAGVSYAAVGANAALALTTATGAAATASTLSELLAAEQLPDLTLVDLTNTASAEVNTDPANTDPASGQAAAAARALAQALGEISGRARIVVVSVAASRTPGPQLAILPAGTTSPLGLKDGLLLGPTTHQPGLIQLTDLTPTLLAAVAGADLPAAAGLTGGMLTLAPSAPNAVDDDASDAASPDAIAALADDAVHAVASHRAVLPVTLLLLAAAAALIAVVVLGLRRPEGASRPGAGRLHLIARAACAAVALPTGIWLTNLLPWWRAGSWAPLVAVLAALAWAAVLTAAALWLGRRMHRLPRGALTARSSRVGDPAAADAPSDARSPRGATPVPRRAALDVTGTHSAWSAALVLTAALPAVILIDAALGASLGFNSPLGMNAVVAGRFYGVSNTAFALAAGALLVAIAAGTDGLRAARPTWRAGMVTAAGVILPGGLALVIDGAPRLGADLGGAITLVPALVTL
ncbi:hypothetical protein, partial [Actinomyces sp. MRS3W]|uniref:hypothetical protein n=1 Tax=Actinomyces sp. MRS3W TaxID=2800796 RepID=UPI0028FD36CE